MMPRFPIRTAVALFALLLIIGFEAKAGLFQAQDEAFVRAIGLKSGESPDWLIAATQAISWLGGGTQRYIMVLLLSLILWRRRGRIYGLAMLAASALSNLSSDLLKSFFDRPRPSLIPHLDHVNSGSYPSGHATSAAAVYLLMLWLVPDQQRKYWAAPMLALFVLTGLSRPMLGVHYPSDVIGGWMLGTAFALLAVAAVNRYQVTT